MTDEIEKGASKAARTRVAKMDRPPYTATGDIDQLLERMAGLAAPQKVDGAWARNYKLKEESIIVLKWLGVATAEGTVDKEVWAKLRVPASRQATLAVLVTKSYGPIFDQIDPAQASRNDIHGAMVTTYGMADTARYIRAFVRLCELAGIVLGGLADPRAEPDEKPEKKPRPVRQPKAASATQSKPKPLEEPKRSSGQAATISVNVEIPAEWTEDQIKERLATVRRALGEPDQ